MSATLSGTELPGEVGAVLQTKPQVVVGPAESMLPAPSASGSSVAIERLELSRLKMRAAMAPPPKRIRTTAPFSFPTFFNHLPDVPGIGFFVDAANSWWDRHPMRPVLTIATRVVNVAARPMATRRPLAMVGTAALVGAALAWARPWRWLLRSALLAGFIPQLAGKLIAKLPLEVWLTNFVQSVKTSTVEKSFPYDAGAGHAMPSAPVRPREF